MSLRAYGLAALSVLAALTSACAASPTSLRAFAGRYELRSVNGRPVPVDALGGALAGELVLTVDGRFTRTVSYARSGLPEPAVMREAGAYDVHGTEITFRGVREGLLAPLGGGVIAWGEVRLPSVFFRYPGPADQGVEEEYVRATN
jgi:hypothetical protein